MSSLFLAVFAYGGHCADTVSHSGSLNPTDYVGISFWLATAIMLAATVLPELKDFYNCAHLKIFRYVFQALLLKYFIY